MLLYPRLLTGQEYPKDYFQLPLPQVPRVSGTFAEFRYDHLHSGIDFPAPMRTPVFAVADGFVSRIRMQAGGFGRALYVDHPNGYTSVYAHLDAFSPVLEVFLKQEQYAQQTFELDYYPDAAAFPVKKGETIALSGNSGISQGPHLHFEIRQTKGEMPTNPLLFGLKVNDNHKPLVKSLRVYHAFPNGSLIEEIPPRLVPVKKSGNAYELKTPGVLAVPPHAIFGVQAVDVDGSGNKNGLFSMQVYFDSILVYHTGMEQFSFDNFRAVNSLIDYNHYQKTRQFVQLTRVAPCNTLRLFKSVQNQGVFDFTDGKAHRVTILLSDYQDNTTSVSFMAQCHEPGNYRFPEYLVRSPLVFPCDQDNHLIEPELRFFIPRGALFDTLNLAYRRKPALTGHYSSVHQLHDGATPLNTSCVISIKAIDLPEAFHDKACLARLDAKGRASYVGGGYQNGWVSGLTRKLGTFVIKVDNTPPSIKPVVKKNKRGKVIQENKLVFKISDNFSGIGSYCAYVNGNWVLMEYNFKNRRLTYHYDQALQAGDNDFELVLTDKMGNQTRYSRQIKR